MYDIYEYNAEGKLIKVSSYFADGKLAMYYLYEILKLIKQGATKGSGLFKGIGGFAIPGKVKKLQVDIHHCNLAHKFG